MFNQNPLLFCIWPLGAQLPEPSAFCALAFRLEQDLLVINKEDAGNVPRLSVFQFLTSHPSSLLSRMKLTRVDAKWILSSPGLRRMISRPTNDSRTDWGLYRAAWRETNSGTWNYSFITGVRVCVFFFVFFLEAHKRCWSLVPKCNE